jgi:hypothetical protein
MKRTNSWPAGTRQDKKRNEGNQQPRVAICNPALLRGQGPQPLYSLLIALRDRIPGKLLSGAGLALFVKADRLARSGVERVDRVPGVDSAMQLQQFVRGVA